MAEDIRREDMSQGLRAKDAELGDGISLHPHGRNQGWRVASVFLSQHILLALCSGPACALAHCHTALHVCSSSQLLLLRVTHSDGLQSEMASQSKAFLP